MRKQYFFSTILVALVLGGCIWVDDDGSRNGFPDYEETVIYINRTDWFVDNMIDGQLVGTVGPQESLRIQSWDLEGRHEFYSIARDTDLTWGPTVFTLYDGETFRIYLEETGMNFQRRSRDSTLAVGVLGITTPEIF